MTTPKITPLAFFESVYNAYQHAEQNAGGAVDYYYEIGGYTIRLRFAGEALVPMLTPALEHLTVATDINKADLTICLWDSESTHVTMPRCPWEGEDCIARGDVRDFSDDRIHTSMSGDTGTVNILDEFTNLGVYWIRAACQVPTYEKGAPLRSILHWWMRKHNRFLVHTAAVGYQNKGVLLVGAGGSGKSTSALTSLLYGLSYVGDDYCLLATDNEPYIYSLYNSAKLDATHIKNLPALLPAISNPEELSMEKALLYVHQYQPSSLVFKLPIQAIFLPKVSGCTETVLSPATPVSALRALAPSSLFQLPDTGQLEFSALANFIKKVPCYHLDLGTELNQIPETIIKVLQK